MGRDSGMGKELVANRKEVVGDQRACSGELIPAGGSRMAGVVDDVVVTGFGREVSQAPTKGNLNLNGRQKEGIQEDLNLKKELIEIKDMGGSGSDFFANSGPEGKALNLTLGESVGKGQSKTVEKASLGLAVFLKAQEQVGLNEAQLLEVSVQNLELQGQPSSEGDLFFSASSNHTTSRGKRGRGRDRVQVAQSRERKGRSSGGHTGGGLLGKRRSLTDCDVFEFRYDDGIFKRSSLMDANVVHRVEAASRSGPTSPHEDPCLELPGCGEPPDNS